jgi:hypothetical protein
MFDPPEGFDDMLGDAVLAPLTGPVLDLDVPDVGVVRARRPMPRSAAALAMSGNPKITPEERHQHLTQFVRDHLEDGEYERLLSGMMADELPGDTITLVARELATWGTARPYVAVIILAVMAGTNWRAVRQRMRSDGIADPMRELPHMHAVIDEIETLALEGTASTGDKDRDRRAREDLMDRLYAPTPEGAERLNGKDYRAQVKPPEGFTPGEVEASFDAFTRAMSGMR